MSVESNPNQTTVENHAENVIEKNDSAPVEESGESTQEVEEIYEARLTTIDEQLEEINLEIEKIQKEILEGSGSSVREIDLKTAQVKKEHLLNERVEAAANYPGDWTLLLQNRMLDPITKEKFISQRTEALEEMKEGVPGMLDKPKTYRAHYEDQVRDYDATIAKVFSSTKIGNASLHDKQPNHLGVGNIGEEGAVFDDAVHEDGSPLTIRQKNSMEAHEKGHGLRDFTSPKDISELRGVIDTEVLQNVAQSSQAASEKRFPSNYLTNPEEIAERMAQLKNYFGMRADEVFTKAHLEHARKHYITDTGLDNSMTSFLECISPRTENDFISVINKYPL